MKDQFSWAKHGRLACKGNGVTDGASSLRFRSAINPLIALFGPRKVLKGVCARKEAKHEPTSVLDMYLCREPFLKSARHTA